MVHNAGVNTWYEAVREGVSLKRLLLRNQICALVRLCCQYKVLAAVSAGSLPRPSLCRRRVAAL